MTEAELIMMELNNRLAEARHHAWLLDEEYEQDGDWREDDYYEGLDEDF